jgi:NAD(P)-dependent dehydrogenase (short-subunit alcohol dehydrogenase family)
MLLNDTVVLVTGASRGLGRALAVAAAREGASLSLCAREAAAVEAVARSCREVGAAGVLAIGADVGDPRDVERLAALTLERFGRVDVLVNNASTLGPVPLPHLGDVRPAAIAEAMEVNVIGPVRLTQALLGGMLLRGRGLVVNLTSDAAIVGYPGWGVYSATKAALEAVTRSWAAEVEGTGVRLLSVDPGDMNTDMHRDAIPDADPAELAWPEDVAERMVGLIAAAPHADRIAVAEVR